MGCDPVLIHSVDDHVHMLVDLARTLTISATVEEVKRRLLPLPPSNCHLEFDRVCGMGFETGGGGEGYLF